jgi:glycosyltransferase involved in cell wall biosynthesis
VYRATAELARQGFVPDLVCLHPSWGEGLFLREILPAARIINYYEFYYRAHGSDVGFDQEFQRITADERGRLRIRNSVHLLSLEDADWGWSPTQWQASQFPPQFLPGISVIHDGIDTGRARPDSEARFQVEGRVFSAGDRVVTYVARNLEPYRGFHVFMRALPAILALHADVHVVIVGADGVSYGKPPMVGENWRQALLAEVGNVIDHSRIHFVGRIPYDRYLSLLQVSNAHVYLTYPFVLSWSMLEAMAAGCAVVASRTAPVEEVIEDGKNGLLFDFFSPAALAETVGRVLDDPLLRRRLGEAARTAIVEGYDLQSICLPRQLAMVDSVLAR